MKINQVLWHGWRTVHPDRRRLRRHAHGTAAAWTCRGLVRLRSPSSAPLPHDLSAPAPCGAALTFVFAGGGYSGVEALAELEDMARDACARHPKTSRG